MSVQVIINNVTYDGIISLSVNRSFTNLCGVFNIGIAFSEDYLKNFPIKVNDICQIKLNDTQVINGYIEKIAINYDAKSYSVTVEGRDRTCDIVDSTVGNQLIYNPPISLRNLILNALKEYNMTFIKVSELYKTADFGETEIQSATIGTSLFSFLESLCRQRQVIITGDGLGNIVLTRASTKAISTYLLAQIDPDINNNNVLSASMAYDFTNRFNLYNVYTQSNPLGFNDLTGTQDPAEQKELIVSTTQNSGYDKSVRKSRIFNMVNENCTTNEDLKRRAQWEANIRRAESKVYSCSVEGFNAEADGFIWSPNLLVNVIDDYCDVNSQLLIADVTYTLSLDRGEMTDLKLVTPDAFTLQVEQDAIDARVNAIGKGFIA